MKTEKEEKAKNSFCQLEKHENGKKGSQLKPALDFVNQLLEKHFLKQIIF